MTRREMSWRIKAMPAAIVVRIKAAALGVVMRPPRPGEARMSDRWRLEASRCGEKREGTHVSIERATSGAHR